MSISNSLANALSGMSAASRLAEVVSSNVANSLTDGYGRRTLNLSSANVGGRGAGVEIGSVDRIVDRGILADRRLADASVGAYNSLVATMSRVQDVVGSPGDGASISSRIVEVEAAVIDAAGDPSSDLRLSLVGESLGSLTQSLNEASDGVQSLRVEADRSISDQIEKLNRSLQQVESLNNDITYSINSGGDASALMDQRQLIIDGIAEIVPVRELDRDGGQVSLMTPGGLSLIDGKAREFDFDHRPVITPDMTFASGGLGGVTLDGDLVGSDGLGKLGGGTLGAAFQARDTELVNAQNNLDVVAADLIGRFQDPTVDPTLAVGQPGLLTDGGAAFDVSNLEGLSSRIGVNASVDPSQGGTITNLRDGVGAVISGPSGSATFLNAISNALSNPLTAVGDLAPKSAAGRAAAHEAEIGSSRLSLEAELSFSTARWSSLKEAEAAQGVDTDYEMQMLLRVEQAYAANARIIQTVETMMQTLMGI